VAGALLELEGISKAYPGVQALDGVSLRLGAGEVLGLIGENGAGKSTLMRVLGGVVRPDAGRIRLDGRERTHLTVAEAQAAGIAFVHQELSMFDNLDAAANVLMGRERLRAGPFRLVDHKACQAQVAPLLERLGADFGPDVPVARLSIAQRQLVEIARALSAEARIIILDEPTSSLTLSETDRLLSIVAALRATGTGVIYITHRLGEVVACADRVLCLRDGRVAGELPRDGIAHAAMTRLMIGRDLQSLYTPPAGPPGEDGLELDGLVTAAFPDRSASLHARPGEILGLAGLVGSGRTSLARAVFGIEPALDGAIRLDGQAARIKSPRDAIARGLYLVPEDRKRSGLVLTMPISQNVTLPALRGHARLGLINPASEARAGEAQRATLRIKAPDAGVQAGTLSGGNQQKVVLGRWLALSPRAIVFDEPTRGVDVGAKGEIYSLMRGLADRGVAVLMISSDMEEVIGVSDRVAVMHEGRVAGTLERSARPRCCAWPSATRRSMGKKELGLLALVLLIGAITASINPRFLSAVNLLNMANLIGLFGVFSIGQGLIIITGGIDLAVGSVFALLGVVFIDLLANHGVPWPAAVAGVLLGGLLIGALHGALVTRAGLQPFVVTLCGLLIYRGAARYYTGDATIGFGYTDGLDGLTWLASGRSLGVPNPFLVLLAVAAVMGVVLHRSVFGRYLFAVGRNEEAARYAGIRTGLVVAGAYILGGLLAGISTVLLVFYTNSVSPSSFGSFYELYAIAAAVLGGCSLRGGEGSIAGIVLGTVLLQILQNLVNILGIPSSLNFAVMGGVILLGALADQQLLRRGKAAPGGQSQPQVGLLRPRKAG
jgi:ribose transport system ATP-binding protein